MFTALRLLKRTNYLLSTQTLRNRDITGLEQCFALHEGCTPEDLREKWRAEPGKRMEDNLRLKESNSVVMNILDDALVYDSVPGDWNAYLMNRAIVDIWVTVGSALSIFAHPSITFLKSSGLITGAVSPRENLTGTWRVRNLLGAIYLQFFWLVTSTGELSRCKYCGRIIAYAPPMPESAGRKPRKDKEFCDSRCRQNYHYHNRIKPTLNPAT